MVCAKDTTICLIHKQKSANETDIRKLFFFALVERNICSLPRAAGSCSSWVSRYHFNVITSRCVHFWYGGCHGNNNNFMTRAECLRACPEPSVSQPAQGPALHAREESNPGRTLSSAGSSSRAGGSPSSSSSSMSRIFTVRGGSASRQATSAATNAHRGRFYLRARHPSRGTAAQHSGPAAR